METNSQRNLAGPESYNHDGEDLLLLSNTMSILRTTLLVWILGYIGGREEYSTVQ